MRGEVGYRLVWNVDSNEVWICFGPRVFDFIVKIYRLLGILYLLVYSHSVVFYKMSFWVKFNSKKPFISGLFDHKMEFNSRKTPKIGLLNRDESVIKSGAVNERIR